MSTEAPAPSEEVPAKNLASPGKQSTRDEINSVSEEQVQELLPSAKVPEENPPQSAMSLEAPVLPSEDSTKNPDVITIDAPSENIRSDKSPSSARVTFGPTTTFPLEENHDDSAPVYLGEASPANSASSTQSVTEVPRASENKAKKTPSFFGDRRRKPLPSLKGTFGSVSTFTKDELQALKTPAYTLPTPSEPTAPTEAPKSLADLALPSNAADTPFEKAKRKPSPKIFNMHRIAKLVQHWRTHSEDLSVHPLAILRNLVLCFHVLQTAHADFMKEHGLPLIHCVFYFAAVKCQDTEHQLKLKDVRGILETFKIDFSCVMREAVNSDFIYDVSVAYNKTEIFAHTITVSSQHDHVPVEELSPMTAPSFQIITTTVLRILHCFYDMSRLQKNTQSHANMMKELALVQTRDRVPSIETFDRIKKNCMILHFASNRNLSTIDMMNMAKEYGLDMSVLPFMSNTIVHGRLVKHHEITEDLKQRLNSCGIERHHLINNLDLVYWLNEVPMLESHEDKDLVLKEFCLAYDKSDAGFDRSEVEISLPFPNLSFFGFLNSLIDPGSSDISSMLLASRKKSLNKSALATKRKVTRDQIEALYREPKKPKIEKVEKAKPVPPPPPPKKVFRDELTVEDRKNLPQIDFSVKTLKLSSDKFQAVLHIWFFLYSIPKKMRFTRTSLDLFIQAILSDLETKIVADSLRGLLFFLGHRFTSTVNQGGFFRVSVRTNILQESTNFLKKKLAPKDETDEDLKKRAKGVCDSLKHYGINISWSRLSVPQRIELFETLCAFVQDSSEIADFMEDTFKSKDQMNEGNMSFEKITKTETNDEPMILIRPLGYDRYKRIYWKFPKDPRIFVQTTEDSLEWNQNEQDAVPVTGPRPSLVLDEEESSQEEETRKSSRMVKIVGWGTLAGENIHLLTASLLADGKYEAGLLENLNELEKPKAAKNEENSDSEEPEYPRTRSRMLSPLQQYENFLY